MSILFALKIRNTFFYPNVKTPTLLVLILNRQVGFGKIMITKVDFILLLSIEKLFV